MLWWPWHQTIVRHDLLFPDGSLYWRNKYPSKYRVVGWYEVKQFGGSIQDRVADRIEIEHVTRDGRRQVARIALYGEEREWRPRWTRWLPIFKKISRVVYCDSNVELGERAGSWKGGLMGWSCEWHKDETMEDAFRRWYKEWNGV